MKPENQLTTGFGLLDYCNNSEDFKGSYGSSDNIELLSYEKLKKYKEHLAIFLNELQTPPKLYEELKQQAQEIFHLIDEYQNCSSAYSEDNFLDYSKIYNLAKELELNWCRLQLNHYDLEEINNNNNQIQRSRISLTSDEQEKLKNYKEEYGKLTKEQIQLVEAVINDDLQSIKLLLQHNIYGMFDFNYAFHYNLFELAHILKREKIKAYFLSIVKESKLSWGLEECFSVCDDVDSLKASNIKSDEGTLKELAAKHGSLKAFDYLCTLRSSSEVKSIEYAHSHSLETAYEYNQFKIIDHCFKMLHRDESLNSSVNINYAVEVVSFFNSLVKVCQFSEGSELSIKSYGFIDYKTKDPMTMLGHYLLELSPLHRSELFYAQLGDYWFVEQFVKLMQSRKQQIAIDLNIIDCLQKWTSINLEEILVKTYIKYFDLVFEYCSFYNEANEAEIIQYILDLLGTAVRNNTYLFEFVVVLFNKLIKLGFIQQYQNFEQFFSKTSFQTYTYKDGERELEKLKLVINASQIKIQPLNCAIDRSALIMAIKIIEYAPSFLMMEDERYGAPLFCALRNYLISRNSSEDYRWHIVINLLESSLKNYGDLFKQKSNAIVIFALVFSEPETIKKILQFYIDNQIAISDVLFDFISRLQPDILKEKKQLKVDLSNRQVTTFSRAQFLSLETGFEQMLSQILLEEREVKRLSHESKTVTRNYVEKCLKLADRSNYQCSYSLAALMHFVISEGNLFDKLLKKFDILSSLKLILKNICNMHNEVIEISHQDYVENLFRGHSHPFAKYFQNYSEIESHWQEIKRNIIECLENKKIEEPELQLPIYLAPTPSLTLPREISALIFSDVFNSKDTNIANVILGLGKKNRAVFHSDLIWKKTYEAYLRNSFTREKPQLVAGFKTYVLQMVTLGKLKPEFYSKQHEELYNLVIKEDVEQLKSKLKQNENLILNENAVHASNSFKTANYAYNSVLEIVVRKRKYKLIPVLLDLIKAYNLQQQCQLGEEPIISTWRLAEFYTVCGDIQNLELLIPHLHTTTNFSFLKLLFIACANGHEKLMIHLFKKHLMLLLTDYHNEVVVYYPAHKSPSYEYFLIYAFENGYAYVGRFFINELIPTFKELEDKQQKDALLSWSKSAIDVLLYRFVAKNSMPNIINFVHQNKIDADIMGSMLESILCLKRISDVKIFLKCPLVTGKISAENILKMVYRNFRSKLSVDDVIDLKAKLDFIFKHAPFVSQTSKEIEEVLDILKRLFIFSIIQEDEILCSFAEAYFKKISLMPDVKKYLEETNQHETFFSRCFFNYKKYSDYSGAVNSINACEITGIKTESDELNYLQPFTAATLKCDITFILKLLENYPELLLLPSVKYPSPLMLVFEVCKVKDLDSVLHLDYEKNIGALKRDYEIIIKTHLHPGNADRLELIVKYCNKQSINLSALSKSILDVCPSLGTLLREKQPLTSFASNPHILMAAPQSTGTNTTNVNENPDTEMQNQNTM